MSVDGVRYVHNRKIDTQLQSLLTSATSTSWRPVPPVVSDTPKDGSSTTFEESKVIIHKRPSKQGEIFRLVYDIPIEDFSLNAWKAVLTTPEMRQEWDPGVESSQLIELFDVDVRITKTYFTLGWPANPRDAITISRTISDGSTLLDVATSLPRSPDEPPYLRPTPPYVRSQVHLFAWVIQQVPGPSGPKIRLTYFWQHDLKAVWSMGMPSRAHHLVSLMIGAVKTVTKFGNSIPMLQGFGLGVGMERMIFDIGRRSLAIDYSIVHEQESDLDHKTPRGMDELRAKKERRRLERSLELLLPKQSSWDVQMITRAPSASLQ
ncbi:9378_t:CDS:2, partial [Acaulospora colombiana]